MKGIARGNRKNEVFALLLFAAATLVASCRGRGGDDLSARSSSALTSSDLLVTTIGHRTDGVISDRSMATTTVTPVGQTYTLTPAGHVTQESRVDGTVRFNRGDTLGRLQCVVTDSATACPTTATTPLPATVSAVALYNGDKISNIRRRLAGGIANTRLEYDSATRNRPDRLVVSQGDCALSSCETSFALAYDVWGSRSTETPSSGQGAGSVSRRFTYGPDKRLRTVRVASPQAPDSSCNPTRWDQIDTDIGYSQLDVLAFRKKHISTSVLQSMRYLRAPDGEVAYTIQSAGSTAADRTTYKYLRLAGGRVLAVRETWSVSGRTSRKYVFIHADRNDSPAAAFLTDHPDSGSTQQWAADRDPWGWSRITGDLSADEIPFEYPGQIRLDGTEATRLAVSAGTCQPQLIEPAVVSNGRRDYDPVAGVYISRDPLGLIGADWASTSANRNLYAYAGFAPLERADFWGLETPGFLDNAVRATPFVGPYLDYQRAYASGQVLPAIASLAYLSMDLFFLGTASPARSAAVRVAETALTGEVRTAGAMVEGAAKNACDGAAKGAEETFTIIDGVRRAKAAEMLGAKTIPATIQVGGRTVARIEVSIEALRSPKASIDVSNMTEAKRFSTTLELTRAGSVPPPISIEPGGVGIPISDVNFSY